MSARRTPSTTKPVDGPAFRAAVRLQPGGPTRRRVLLLVAAWTDAGQISTSAFDVADRLGLDLRKAQCLLRRLEDDSFLQATRATARRRFPRYRVAPEHLPAELAPAESEVVA